MSSNVRRLPKLLAIVVFVWCLACGTRAAANSCADGGGPRPDEGGIGGTGLRPSGPGDDDSGVGGTGVSARGETGIIGTITGFASVCVGGVEIHYSADTPVQVDGRSATAAQLAVGQVAEVVATGSGSDVTAEQITVLHVITGPVTRVDNERNAIDVVGATVQLSPRTRVANGDQQSVADATAFPVHSFVEVSGMRRADGVVVASQISQVEPRETVQVVGPVTKLDPEMLMIAGASVRIENGGAISVGDQIRVVGGWDGNAIVAYAVKSISPIPFDGRVDRVDIEGFVRQTTAERLQLGPFSVEVAPAATRDTQQLPQLPAAETRIRIQGIVQNGRVIAQRIGVMDELPSLPPLPPRDPRGWNGGRSVNGRDGGGSFPPDHPGFADHGGPPPRDGQNMMPDGASGFGGPPRPEWGDRPPAPQMPDRPPPPQLPDRPPRPQLPDRPPRIQLPDRPPLPQIPDRPSRPDLPVRPEIPRRP